MMTKTRTVLAVCLALILSTTSFAVTISIEEIGIGRLGIFVDTSPENYAFQNGGLDLTVSSSPPGALVFTDASVYVPLTAGGFWNRWASTKVDGVSASSIGLLRGVSLNSIGLSDVAPGNREPDGRYKFATINYISKSENFHVSVALQNVNGAIHLGQDVSSSITFVPFIHIPEPGTMALAGTSLVGLVLRRRG